MILERGNMWDIFGKTDLFCITTNLTVTKEGKAVMGRGIAKETSDRFPDFKEKLAKRIEHWKHMQQYDDALARPFFFVTPKGCTQKFGCFTVKYNWNEKADTQLIKLCAKDLQAIAESAPFNRIDLNFPGIGNGGLKREEVLPLIEELPDNVHVWEYK